MAKRSAATASNAIVRTVAARPPTQIIQVRASRAPTTHKKKKGHRRHGGAAGLTNKTLMGAAIGGAALGFVDKQFPTLPTLPLVGRAGTIALIAWFLSKQRGGIGTIARDVALAGAAVAGYELGKEGKVSGVGYAVPQVSGGIARQI